MWQEFKAFISQSNVMDLAVGVIVGGAFSKIVTALVDNILMPIIGIILGGVDFSGLMIKVGSAQIMYGAFIQAVIDFLIIALCLFFIVKALNAFKRKPKEEAPAEPTAEEKQLALLEQIRDELRQSAK